MKRWFRFSPLMLGALGGCVAGSHSPIRQATRATAQALCNAAFVSRLDPARTLHAQLHAEPGMKLIDWALRYRVDRADRSATASLAGGSRARSVFRAGRGCTLVYGTGPLPDPLDAAPSVAAALPDIAGAGPVVAATASIRAAIDAAFAESNTGAVRATQAIVIVHRGRVIGERYAPGITVDTPLDSHSLAKSVVNALIGVLVRDGKLSLDQLVTVPSIAGPGTASRTTIAHLLRMNPGFGVDEGPGASVSSAIWYQEADTAAASAASIARSPRGEEWGYCNRCYMLLSRLIGDAVGGGPQGVRTFAENRLFGPLGMRNVVLEFDQAGTLMGANAIFASARDFARFGLLYRHDGMAGERRILPVDWVAMSSRATPGTGYGAGFWLNNIQGPMPIWPIDWGLPHSPADTFFARGHLGQYIVIVPSHDLVIVRMGQSHGRGAERESVGQLTADVISALGP